jgi:6-phosphogluconolactonase/glucosamine-6-phosphate isomerase/deaminase
MRATIRLLSSDPDVAGVVPAKIALFLVAGQEKRDALRAMVAGSDTPAARVAARRIVVVADEAASI